jgi:hypothetical protein
MVSHLTTATGCRRSLQAEPGRRLEDHSGKGLPDPRPKISSELTATRVDNSCSSPLRTAPRYPTHHPWLRHLPRAQERASTFPAKTRRSPAALSPTGARSRRSPMPHTARISASSIALTQGPRPAGADAVWPNAPVRPASQVPVSGARTHRSATPVGKTAENALATHNGGSVRAKGYEVRLVSRVASLPQVAGCGCGP